MDPCKSLLKTYLRTIKSCGGMNEIPLILTRDFRLSSWNTEIYE